MDRSITVAYAVRSGLHPLDEPSRRITQNERAIYLVGVDFVEKRLLVEAPSSHSQSDLVYILEMGPRKGSL